jgi:ComF family protein
VNISVAPAVELALDLLFPAHCVHCGANGELLCELCVLSLTPYPDASCSKCGEPTHGPDLCDRCAADPPAITRMSVGYLFDDIARDAIHALKYDDIRAIAPLLGTLLSEYLIGLRRTPDVIIPVPLHSGRARERGFNQAEALSTRVGELLSVPVNTDILRRTINIPHQAGLRRESRERNIVDAFEARKLPDGMHIMLIDDVTTTDSTLEECARTLKAAGAARVDAAVFAKEA